VSQVAHVQTVHQTPELNHGKDKEMPIAKVMSAQIQAPQLRPTSTLPTVLVSNALVALFQANQIHPMVSELDVFQVETLVETLVLDVSNIEISIMYAKLAQETPL